MKNLRLCPFCREDINPSFPNLYQMDDDKWLLSHYCRIKHLELTVTIDIYGDTEEEVIDYWNGDYEKPKSESL